MSEQEQKLLQRIAELESSLQSWKNYAFWWRDKWANEFWEPRGWQYSKALTKLGVVRDD